MTSPVDAEPCQWSMWPTPQGKPCRRCGDTAFEHEHSGSSTACVACYRCPAFAGGFAAFVHAITKRWP